MKSSRSFSSSAAKKRTVPNAKHNKFNGYSKFDTRQSLRDDIQGWEKSRVSLDIVVAVFFLLLLVGLLWWRCLAVRTASFINSKRRKKKVDDFCEQCQITDGSDNSDCEDPDFENSL